jgi:hypothetical protein
VICKPFMPPLHNPTMKKKSSMEIHWVFIAIDENYKMP